MTHIGFFSLFFVSSITALLLTSNDQRGKKYTVFFSLILIFLFITLMLLRDVSAGSDFGNYTAMYEQQGSFNNVWEVYHRNYTFSFLQYLGQTVGLDSKQFYSVFSIFSALLVYRAFYLFFEDKRLALLAFGFFLLSSTFIFMYANTLRQGLALSLMMLSISYYWKRKYIVFFVFSILAIFSHFSSVIFLVSVVLAKWVPLKGVIGRLYLLVLLLLPFMGYIVLEVTGLSSISKSLERYSEHGYSSNIFYVKLVISYLFIVLLFLLNKSSKSNASPSKMKFYEKYTYIYSIYGYLIAASFIFLSIPIVSSRLHYFSNAFMPILAVTFLFTSFRFKFETKIFLVFLLAMSVGVVSYLYPSSASQLGVYG